MGGEEVAVAEISTLAASGGMELAGAVAEASIYTSKTTPRSFNCTRKCDNCPGVANVTFAKVSPFAVTFAKTPQGT